MKACKTIDKEIYKRLIAERFILIAGSSLFMILSAAPMWITIRLLPLQQCLLLYSPSVVIAPSFFVAERLLLKIILFCLYSKLALFVELGERTIAQI